MKLPIVDLSGCNKEAMISVIDELISDEYYADYLCHCLEYMFEGKASTPRTVAAEFLHNAIQNSLASMPDHPSARCTPFKNLIVVFTDHSGLIGWLRLSTFSECEIEKLLDIQKKHEGCSPFINCERKILDEARTFKSYPIISEAVVRLQWLNQIRDSLK